MPARPAPGAPKPRGRGGPAMSQGLHIKTVPGRYAVVRLKEDAEYPAWLNGPGFQAAIRSDDELTLVCLQDRVPSKVEAERDWYCLRTIGPFPFQSAGIVLSIIAPLSGNGIGVFVVCTYDGEHVLVPAKDAHRARHLLQEAGHIWNDPDDDGGN